MVEQLCLPCFKETLHEASDSALVCKTCGTVSEFINSNGNAGKSGIGVSGVGESGEGETPSSLPPTASTPNAYAEMLHGKGLVALDGDPGLARFVFDKAGLTFLQDEPQAIKLGDSTMRVRLWVDDHDLYVIRPVTGEKAPIFPGTDIQALKLGQFYASICAGTLIRPVEAELARWKRRALIEWGVVTARAVHLRPLPKDAPRYAVTVWDGIGLLVAVRRLTEPDETEFPLTRSFLPGWCGCEVKVVKRGMGWLDRHRFVWRTRSVPVGKPKPMTLWAVAEEDGG